MYTVEEVARKLGRATASCCWQDVVMYRDTLDKLQRISDYQRSEWAPEQIAANMPASLVIAVNS